MKLSKIIKTSLLLSLFFSLLLLLGIFSFETLKADSGTTIKLDYVAGMDASGNATGTANVQVNTQVIKGNYLYTGGAGNATACSQVAGNAEGCELKVFDISDPENPVYVAGRDTSGNATGTDNVNIITLTIKDDYLFVGRNGKYSTPCSQTPGLDFGCELQVYDISSSTNPVYVAGRDADGSATGNIALVDILSLTTHGGYLFVGKSFNTTSCSQSEGMAEGSVNYKFMI